VLELRDATESDRTLFWEVQRTAMRPAVEAMWGWDEAFQKRYFNEHFSTSGRYVVRVDGIEAGILCFSVREDHLFLANVALLPHCQGKGLGTQLIRLVLEQAGRLGVPVRLQVLKTNRSHRLYERLGFEVCGESETHFQMVHDGQQLDAPDERGWRSKPPARG
jgi:ribosomal protein S18 acetylase RimI-like enzyme